MKRPTKAEQEVVRLRGLLAAKEIQIGEQQKDISGWKATALFHTCKPEVKEVHVKGETVYRIPKWYHVVDILVFSTLASLAWHFYSTPRIVEKPYYVTVTKAPSDYEETKSVLAECRDDWRMDQLRIKVLEAWKRNHELQ